MIFGALRRGRKAQQAEERRVALRLRKLRRTLGFVHLLEQSVRADKVPADSILGCDMLPHGICTVFHRVLRSLSRALPMRGALRCSGLAARGPLAILVAVFRQLDVAPAVLVGGRDDVVDAVFSLEFQLWLRNVEQLLAQSGLLSVGLGSSSQRVWD